MRRDVVIRRSLLPKLDDELRSCVVYVTLRWNGEAGSEEDAVHLARREGDVEDWDVAWREERSARTICKICGEAEEEKK